MLIHINFQSERGRHICCVNGSAVEPRGGSSVTNLPISTTWSDILRPVRTGQLSISHDRFQSLYWINIKISVPDHIFRMCHAEVFTCKLTENCPLFHMDNVQIAKCQAKLDNVVSKRGKCLRNMEIKAVFSYKCVENGSCYFFCYSMNYEITILSTFSRSISKLCHVKYYVDEQQ